MQGRHPGRHRRETPHHTKARRWNERKGRWAEAIAAALLMLKGYRILERRSRSRSGEIDIVALRGDRLAFIEVKLRRTLDEARAALTPRQAARMGRAATAWVWHRPAFRSHRMSFDAILLAPGRLPSHAEHALERF